jgi:uncharacterized protein
MSNGRFVWFELVTRALGSAQGFYQRLFDWRVDLTDAGSDTYPTLRAGDHAFGGLTRLDRRGETASYWLSYLACADVDQACQRACALGGTIEREPSSLPASGRFAYLRDPHGALFGVVQGGPAATLPAPDRTPHGQFGFSELWTPDPRASMAFYGELLGWSRGRGIDLGPPGTYQVVRQDEFDVGGLMPSAVGFHGRIAWVHYVHVPRVDPVVERARTLGATIFVPPEDLAGMGRFAILEDPTGAVFAVYNVL